MLQEFVWSETQRRGRVLQREKRLTALGAEEMTMPLFCFQTAIKSFYFAALIYEYQEASACYCCLHSVLNSGSLLAVLKTSAVMLHISP